MKYLIPLFVVFLCCAPQKDKYPKIEIQQEEYEIYSAFFNEFISSLPDTVKHVQIFIADSLGRNESIELLENILTDQKWNLKNDSTLLEMKIDIMRKEAHKVHFEDKLSLSTNDVVTPVFVIKPAYEKYLTKPTYKPKTIKLRDNSYLKVMCIVFNNIYPESPGIFYLNRVGFNKNKTKAKLSCMLLMGPYTPRPFDRIYKKVEGTWVVEKTN